MEDGRRCEAGEVWELTNPPGRSLLAICVAGGPATATYAQAEFVVLDDVFDGREGGWAPGKRACFPVLDPGYRWRRLA